MKKYFTDILAHYDYSSTSEFMRSLFPSLKFDASLPIMLIGILSAIADKLFGMTPLALAAMLCMFILELATGLLAAKSRKEKITSRKLSRFGVKVAVYLILISIPYLFYRSYENRDNHSAAVVFDWLHIFLVIHVTQEHVVSILENLASIQGKDKSYWINQIKEKFKPKP